MTVHVDVVAPGQALITGPGFSGRAWRARGRVHVEDTDSEQYVGTARSYEAGGQLLAAYHGQPDQRVKVDRE